MSRVSGKRRERRDKGAEYFIRCRDRPAKLYFNIYLLVVTSSGAKELRLRELRGARLFIAGANKFSRNK